jgi:hypothetical protein
MEEHFDHCGFCVHYKPNKGDLQNGKCVAPIPAAILLMLDGPLNSDVHATMEVQCDCYEKSGKAVGGFFCAYCGNLCLGTGANQNAEEFRNPVDPTDTGAYCSVDCAITAGEDYEGAR